MEGLAGSLSLVTGFFKSLFKKSIKLKEKLQEIKFKPQ